MVSGVPVDEPEVAQLYRSLRRRDDGQRVPKTAMPAVDAGHRPDAAAPVALGDIESIVRAGQAAERVHAFSQAADLYHRVLKLMKQFAPAARS